MSRRRIAALALIATLALPVAAAAPLDDAPVQGADVPEIAPRDPPEDPKETLKDVLGDDKDDSKPDDGSGSDGWWDWDDVGRVGSGVADALTSQWGLAALVFSALGAGGIWWFGGARLTTPEEVLENDVRESIYEYVNETTGAHLHQISEDLDLSTTSAVWHLRKLEDAGLVRSDKFNGYRVFYPQEGGVEAKKLSIGVNVLSNDNALSIFEHLAREPGKHQRAIARALDINHGTVRWHLRKMRKAEMVVETKKGNTTKYFPTDLGRQSLQEAAGIVVDVAEQPTPDPDATPTA